MSEDLVVSLPVSKWNMLASLSHAVVSGFGIDPIHLWHFEHDHGVWVTGSGGFEQNWGKPGFCMESTANVTFPWGKRVADILDSALSYHIHWSGTPVLLALFGQSCHY